MQCAHLFCPPDLRNLEAMIKVFGNFKYYNSDFQRTSCYGSYSDYLRASGLMVV